MAYKAYKKSYSAQGLEASQRKDQRISFLSLFSSLSQLPEKYLDDLMKKHEAKDVFDLALKLNIQLYVEYQFPDKEMEEKTKPTEEGFVPKPDTPPF